MSDTPAFLRLHPGDDVAVALADLAAGERAGTDGPVLAAPIPAGHKFAMTPIAAGAAVRKYGQVIGTASMDIDPGAHVHVHNLESRVPEGVVARADGDSDRALASDAGTFEGFRRDHGRAGTRNYVAIVATVNCSATVVRHIAARFPETVLAEWEQVDGLCPLTHTTGCGMADGSEGLELLQRTLGGYIAHPNVGAALVIGLGCEVNDIDRLLAKSGLAPGERLRTMSIQAIGGTRAAIDEGERLVRELLDVANRARREPSPLSDLCLALQCGGSDGFSGITANPALGLAADRLVAAGGTVVLSETPEIHGAEHLLLARAESEAVADALRARLAWWDDYVARHGASLDNNPSPGNLAGGISTILEKSLGAVMKCGGTPLRGVVRYAERIEQPGFVFMDGPGYDPCSVTGEIASGANLVCFTTGRGSVFGAKPAPSVKLATNPGVAGRMAEDMDYDCGRILRGERSLDQAGEAIFELLVATASGRRSASEINGLGDFEFVPWQLGAVL